jgi:signal transduction histidine kinase
MNVIRGYAETMAESNTGQTGVWATNILESSDELLETIDKERRITEVIDESASTKPMAVAPMLTRIKNRLEERYGAATVDVTVEQDLTIAADPTVEDAIEELAENAILHSERDGPTVELAGHRDSDPVSITVADNGPGLPDMERNILKKDQEMNPLFHGSGLGLWFVKIVADQNNGEVRVIETDGRGTKIAVEIPSQGA